MSIFEQSQPKEVHPGELADMIEKRHGTRKLVKVAVSHELLFTLFHEGEKSGGIIECIEGIPSGAAFMGATYANLSVTYVFAHETFEPVPDGAEIPVKQIKWRMHYVNEEESSG